VVEGRDPQVALFLVNLGRTLRKLGRNEEAIARLRETIELTRDEPVHFAEVGAHYTLSEILRATDTKAADEVLAAGRKRCAAADADARAAASCERLD
jgi:hypothetical protein